MPRQGRINIAGGIYHIIQRGLERWEIFKNDEDREEFLRRSAEGVENTGHKCYGWVLMPNHFHLLIRSGVKPLSELMSRLLTGYAVYFNRKYKRSGYLYQNRYKSILCQEDNYLLELVRYIHLNPLRAKLVKDMEGLNKYKWSGHSVLIGNNKEVKWQSTDDILELFGRKPNEAVKKYIEFVKEAKDINHREELSGGGLIRSAGGWKEAVRLSRSRHKQLGDERMLGDGEFVSSILKESEENLNRREHLKREGWDKEKLIKRVCGLMNIKEEDIYKRSKNSRISKARNLLTYWGKKELGITGSELGRLLNITGSAISQSIKKGEKLARENNHKLIT